MSAWTSTTEVKIIKTQRLQGYILKVELKIFADELDIVCKEERPWLAPRFLT